MSDLGITPEQLLESNIFDALGFDKLPESQKQDMIVKLSEAVTNGVIIRISNILSEEDHNEWQKLISAGKDKESIEYLVKHNIDINALAAQEALTIKAQLMDTVSPNQPSN